MRYAPVALTLVLPLLLNAAQITRSAAEFRSAVEGAQPGDTILLAPGVYDLGGPLTLTRSGVPGRPIVLGGLRTGKTELRGESRFALDRLSYVVLKGFLFTATNGPAVRLRGCTHIRVTRNVFRLRETARSNWVMITGMPGDTAALSGGNRIDHNLFERKREVGNFLTIEGTAGSRFHVSHDDTIDRNHFRDIGPRVENGLEAIRIGSSNFSLSSGRTLLERNLFERCDGDPEFVSVKSSDNVIRYNTFRECLGVLSLRHGNRNTIDGNFLLGNGRAGSFRDSTGRIWRLGTGGIRFYGDSMTIVNNYFEGLTGSRWDATLAVTNGDAEYGEGKPLTKHYRIRDALIAFNTLVDNASTLEIGYDGEGFQGNWWRLPPTGLMIANNIMSGNQDTLIKIFADPVGCRWEGNLLHPTGKAAAWNRPVPGAMIANPGLRRQGGIWRPVRGSRAIGAASGSHPSVLFDIDGQPRSARKDVGADQLALTIARPLKPADVGPFSPE